jgi:hypothetical protein
MSIHLFQSTVASWFLRPRALNLVLAAWLSLSALLFPHLPAQRVVSLLSGIAAAGLALMARRSVAAHRAVVAVGFGIILSFFLFWPLPATAWNNTVVAIAMAWLATMDPDQFSSGRSPARPFLAILTARLDFQRVRKVTARPALRPKNERPEARSSVSAPLLAWNEKCWEQSRPVDPAN